MNAASKRPPVGEVLLPLRTVGGKVPPVTHIRSTLLASSIQTLRGRGFIDEYLRKLPREHHAGVLEAVAGSWMPIAIAMAHYAAADALGLSALDQYNNGREVAGRVQNPMLGTLVRAAKGAGVTPWLGLENFQRMWDRVLMGGAGCVYRVGPKEARVEAHGNPLVLSPYFKNSWRGMFSGSGELFCSKIYISEVSAPTTALSHLPFVMRVAWA